MNLVIWLSSACHIGDTQPWAPPEGSQAATHGTGVVWWERGGGGVFQLLLLEAKGKRAIWELTVGVPVYSDLGSCAWDAVSPLQLCHVLSRFVSITVPCSPEGSTLGLETLLGDPGWLSVGKSDRSRGGVGKDC